jgi:uncharacterized C2H2 Zn-finger protein
VTVQLHCPSGCSDGRFEALNAQIVANAEGEYVGHDFSQATFRCMRCQSIAVDVAAAAREMHRHEFSEPTLTCPSCGMVMLPPEDDPFVERVACPSCDQVFSVEEGTRSLHRGDVTDGDEH